MAGSFLWSQQEVVMTEEEVRKIVREEIDAALRKFAADFTKGVKRAQGRRLG